MSTCRGKENEVPSLSLVYRIEDERGWGPFHSGRTRDGSGKALQWAVPQKDWGYWNKFPTWAGEDFYFSKADDEVREEWQNLRSGFKNREQMLEWFPRSRWRWKLRVLGYKLVTYEVPSNWVFVLSKQVVFNVSRATKIGEEEIIQRRWTYRVGLGVCEKTKACP